VLEEVSGDWEQAEKKWIADLRSQGDLTNVKPGGQGVPLDREDITQKLLEIRRSPKYRALMAERTRAAWEHREHSHTPETLAKLRETMRRPEILAALSASHMGKVPSTKGIKTGPYSPQQKLSHDAAMALPDTRRKLSLAHMGQGKGQKRPAEWGQHISQALRLRRERLSAQ